MNVNLCGTKSGHYIQMYRHAKRAVTILQTKLPVDAKSIIGICGTYQALWHLIIPKI